MAEQEMQSGISMHYLESIARVAPNMTVAKLVAMLRGDDAADAREDTASNTEASGLTKASSTPAAEDFEVSSTAADSSAASLQIAPSTGHRPTDVPEANGQGDARSVIQELSSCETNDVSTLSATEHSDQLADSSRQENAQSTSLQSSTTTPQLADDDENGGINLDAAGTPNCLDQTQSLPSAALSFARDSNATIAPGNNDLRTAGSTDGAASLTQQMQAPSSLMSNAIASSTAGSNLRRPSGAPDVHHSSLEIYGDVSGEGLLQMDNGIGIHELFGARMLLIAATGKPYTEIFKILNSKPNVPGRKLKSSKIIDHRVANALKHIFNAFDDPSYKARKQELSEAQSDPVRRQAYIQMLKNPATYNINPRAQCGECKTGTQPIQTGMPASQQSSPVLPAAGHLYHPFPALPSSSSATNDRAVDSSWSQLPQVPTPPAAPLRRQRRKAKTSTETAATNTISSVGRMAKAPSRKRAAAALELQMGEDANKRWQGESQPAYPQTQSSDGISFIQDATASSQPGYPQARSTYGQFFNQAPSAFFQSTHQSEATGRSNIPAFQAGEAHHMAPPPQV